MCVRTCVLTLLSTACRETTLRPFAARAPRWLIEHSVMSPPFHWGLSQSAQARLLNRLPHRHHSPILDEDLGAWRDCFKGWQRDGEPCYHWYSTRPLSYLYSLNLTGWSCMRVIQLPAVCWLNPVRFHVFMTPLLASTFYVLDSKRDYSCYKVNRRRLDVTVPALHSWHHGWNMHCTCSKWLHA